MKSKRVKKLIPDNERKWYAVYTRSRFEKKVNEKLIEKDVEVLLPLQKTVRQWSDRKKTVEIPLIRSYVFVKINFNDYLKVLDTHGVVKFVTYICNSNPAPIPEEQLNNLIILTRTDNDIKTTSEKLNPGDKIEVTSGVLNGLKGELIEYHGNKKVVVKINHLNTSLLVTVPSFQICYKGDGEN
jgi:transcriptional antiterminator RfaH